MSAEQHGKHAEPVAPVLERNEIKKTLVIDEFGKSSKENKGVKYWKPTFSETNWDNDVTWFGRGFIAAVVGRKVRSMFGALHLEYIDKETGKLNFTAWEQAALEFEVSSEEGKKDLEQERADLADRIFTITDDDAFGILPGETPTPRYLELKAELEELGNQNTILKAKIRAIDQKYAEIVEKRKATQAKQAAEAAAKFEAAKAAGATA